MTEFAVEPAVEAEVPASAETWQIEVDHSSYYRWVPVKDEDVIEGDVVIDSTWDGFKKKRILINEPTTSTTGVYVPNLHAENDDRVAAGGSKKSLSALLSRHLEDGPWPKHFPLDSITAICCSEPTIAAKLASYFLEN